MDDQLYSFAFRGLLTKEALDRSARLPKIPQSAAIDAAIAEAKSVALDLLDEAGRDRSGPPNDQKLARSGLRCPRFLNSWAPVGRDQKWRNLARACDAVRS